MKLTKSYLGNDLTIDFTALAVANIEETGIDWTDDYHDVRTGQITEEALREKCLDGCDQDRHTGWIDYCEEIVRAAH